MRNFIFKRLKSFKSLFFVVLFLFSSFSVFSQYSTKHYIAAAPWDYSSNANEFVIASASGTAIVAITKSDGTAITILSVASGTPVAYRPLGAPASKPANAINTIYNDRGLIFTSDLPIAVSVRNVESDQIGGGNPNQIKGNSSLSSYGNEAIGSSFRVGYYRSDFTGLYNYAPAGFPAAAVAPVYSVMAIDNNTVISINGTVLVTLNVGQSYLFQTTIGNLVTATKPVVMNSGQWRDQPTGCGDAVLNEIPPVRVLGKNYLVVRGNGTTRGASVATNFPEQTIFIATADNTRVTVSTVNALGVVTGTNSYVLPTAGSYQSIFHGIDGVKYSASAISADKNIMVYSGTAEGCEVDMTCVAPVSACTGSFRVETKKFTRYDNSNLPYFGYALVNSATDKVFFNGVDLETIASARFQIGATGFYIIGFTNAQLSNPTDLVFTSAVRMSLSMVQQGGGFSMASYLSSFNDAAAQQFSPTVNGSGCVTTLTAEPGLEPYQWYLNDVLIPGATSQTYVPTSTGSYSVSGTKTCGLSVASTPVVVNCIPIDAVDDGTAASPFATVISGSTLATSVKANDFINGVSVTSSSTIVTPKTQGPLTIDASGIITVASGTVNGIYTIDYDLCSTLLSPTICDKATAYVKVTVQPGSIASDQTICSGADPAAFTSVSNAVGVGTISYRWESAVSPFATWTAISGATAATYDAPSGLTATTKYHRIAICTLGESDPTSPVTITVTPLNTIAAGSSQTVCINSAITNITLATTGATGATVTGLPTGVTGTWAANVVTISGTPTVSGAFNYTVKTTGGCPSVQATGILTINSAPVAATLGANSPVCSGSDAVFTITGTAGNTVTYTGAASGTATIGAGGTVAVTVAAVTAATTLNLTNVSNGTCNRALTATATVSVNVLPVAASLSSNSPVCSGSDAVFTITGTAGNTVTYTGAASGTATIGAAGTVAVTITGITAAKTLKLTNVSNGICNRSLSVTNTVSITPKPADIVTNQTICSGETFTWNGTNYTTNQTATRFPGADGCTADQVLNLTVTPKPADIVTNQTICSGETFTWNGTNYTTNQTATRFPGADGCTADQVLNLTVTPKPADIVTYQTICSGETFTWNGTNYTTNQTATRFPGADGCTADQLLNLTVTPKPADIVTNQTICSGETFTWNGTNYTTNQTATRFPGADGCTADQVLNLTVTPKPADIVTNQTICSGETFTWNGTNYTTNQTATRFPGANGCTADQVLNLTVTSKPADIVTNQTICSGEIFTWNGTNYTTNQTATRFPGADGCTADQVLNLTATPKPADIVISAIICLGATYTWVMNSVNYNIGGTYVIVNNGCTPNFVLNLTVNTPPNAGTLSGTQSICVSGTTTFSSTVAGGTWSTNDASIATVDPATGVITGVSAGTATITYKVIGTGGCPDATVTRTINVYSPTVSLSGSTTVLENAAGTVDLTASLSTLSYEDVTINLSFTGSASGLDYNASGASILIPAGSLSGKVTIDPIDDSIFEGDETVIANIASVVGGCATENGVQVTTVTILDNETTPMVSISSPTVTEGTYAVFTVSIDVASSVDTVVDVVTSTGTAGTLDYTTTSTTVTIPAGQTSVKVSVPTTDDTIDEPAENFSLNGTVTSGNTSNTDPVGTAIINDNDATPAVSISSPTVTEGATADFVVSITGVSSVDTVVDVVTTTGTAGTSDYTVTTTTVTIPAGQTIVNVSVPTTDDAIDEPAENFSLKGTVTSGNTSNTDPVGTAIINDNDATPAVSISSPTVTEGATADFVVSITGVSSVDTVVDVVTTTGTAGTSDYTVTTTTVTIPAGQTIVNVSVPTTDDAIDEPAENFSLNGTVTSGNTSNTDPVGTAIINDNDATPAVSISSPTVTEGATADFVVSITGVSSVDTVVDVVTTTGTAGTSDYTVTTTTVTIPAGHTSVNVSVPTTDDTTNEPSESFTLNATVTSGNTSNTTADGTATINDNDIPAPAPPSIFADDDLAGPITSINSIQNILNVLANDFVDLNKATLSNVTLSTVTADPTGFMTLKADGTVELAPNTPAGTYTLTYSICDVSNSNNCASAKVTVMVICNTSTAVSGKVYNAGTNAPLANVPITLKPINTTKGPVLLRLTKADGSYAFTGMIPGDYVIQVQDANLNAAQDLYNTTSSFLILNVENCNDQKIDFGYDKTDLLVLGDFVWYDLNNNGIQDEWYDANNDGLVTQNVPDANGVVDYSKWEWIDFNGDGSYKGKQNAGELNAAGFGNGTTSVANIFVTGPNGFSRSVTMGVEGYWRTRAPQGAYGEYKIEFIKEGNFELASEAMSASGLVKVLPSGTLKQASTSKSKSYVDCGLTTNNILYAQFSATEKVHLDLDFGISCKTYADIVATNDDAGSVDGSKASTGILNAFSNDTFNGLPVNPSDVILTSNPDANFKFNADGTIDALPNIPGGTYTLTYSICEKANPSNCSQASITIFVASPSIALVKTAKFNDENNDGYAQVNETITYSFEVTNTGNVPLTNITITDPLPGVVMSGTPLVLAVGESNTTHFTGEYSIKQSDINSGSISNQATVYGTAPSGTVVEDKSDEMNLVNDNPTVLSVSGCAIQVFNAVSPDGSGQNDRFYIRGLECYPENSIEIFNRWGVLVFEREHYNNEDRAFRGTSEGRVTLEKSSELPVGTYFYILKYKDSNNNTFEKSGYLYLNRK